MSNTLDLDLIEKEKSRLLAVIQAATDGFVEATGLLPMITIEVKKTETRCGTHKGNPVVTVNVLL